MRSTSKLAALAICIAIVLSMAGCPGGSQPEVTIMAPPDGAQARIGEEVAVHSYAAYDSGVSRVDLKVDGVLLRSDASADPEGEPSLTVVQGWMPETTGAHTLMVTAYGANGEASEPASITVNVAEAEPTATPTLSPTATPEGEEEEEVQEQAAGCNNSAYVADITIPDGTSFAPGASFAKTWRLKNTGTCDWGAGYQLVHVGGSQMSAASGVSVAATPAGATVDVTANMTAPAEPGNYTGRWQMKSADGQLFGGVFTVVIQVKGATTPTATATTGPPSEAKIEFWADSTSIEQGECTKLHWKVENAKEVYYQEGGVVGEGEREECPGVTRTFKLRVIHASGETTKEVTVNVEAGGDSFSNFQVVEEDSDSIRIRVDYKYVSDHGDPIAITAFPFNSAGKSVPSIGVDPGTANAGEGTADIYVRYNGAGTPASNQIEIRMVAQGSSPTSTGFYSQRFDFDKTWSEAGGDDLSNFRTQNIDDYEIRITVDYDYASSHGNPVYIVARAYSGDDELISFGGSPATINPGSGTATLSLEYYGIGTVTSDGVDLLISEDEDGDLPFYTEIFNFSKEWGG